MTITVADYLLTRLKELGIRAIFGVPGDYNLAFLDYIVHDTDLKWIGNCNELNAAYAADGYAHSNKIGALVTTFGVGELSAINGIAGSFAEHIPIINIVGMPALTLQQKKLLLHHNINKDSFDNFIHMHKTVTAAQTMLTKEKPGKEIDDILIICWKEKRPVYIGIPVDIVDFNIEAPNQQLDLSLPKSDPKALQEALLQVAGKIQAAKKPLLILDVYAARQQLMSLIKCFIEKTTIPFVTTPMGKAIVHENAPNFIGLYVGKYSEEIVLKNINEADCILTFGWIQSDINTAGFTSISKEDYAIDIEKDNVRIDKAHYFNVQMQDFIPALLEKLSNDQYPLNTLIPKIKTSFTPTKNKLDLQHFWQRMESFIQENDVILAEVGTSFFGLLEISLPQNTKIISQAIWGSIGYTLPALLGSLIASLRRHVLFIGDGSLQVTVQELSTIIQHKLCPIIFLINNDGYTIERVIHGEKETYNAIQPWNYSTLPYMFGEAVWSAHVKTEEELDNVLSAIHDYPNKLRFIEIDTSQMDAPELLMKILS